MCSVIRGMVLGGISSAMIVVSSSAAQDPAGELLSVSVGSVHACGVSAAGAIHCWGNGRYGQLGNGAAEDSELAPVRVRSAVRFRMVTAGATHSCALARDGSAYCWGTDVSGVLGDADLTERCDGTPCATTPTPVARGMRFDTLAAGYEHSCALRRGRAYCWGRNAEGQLGRERSGEECGGVACGRSALAVDTALRFRAISVRGRHSCALSGEDAYCWGDNEYGQLAAPLTVSSSATPLRVATAWPLRSVTAGGLYGCALTRRGEVACWGRVPPEEGALGPETRGARLLFGERDAPRFVSLGAGGEHACALAADGGIHCWGAGLYNRLGAQPAERCGEIPCSRVPLRLSLTSRYHTLSVGGTSSCAIAADRLTCWGGSAAESAVARSLASR
jgi:alpha-tubulin suppressor-like RCC1 family protein